MKSIENVNVTKSILTLFYKRKKKKIIVTHQKLVPCSLSVCSPTSDHRVVSR